MSALHDALSSTGTAYADARDAALPAMERSQLARLRSSRSAAVRVVARAWLARLDDPVTAGRFDGAFDRVERIARSSIRKRTPDPVEVGTGLAARLGRANLPLAAERLVRPPEDLPGWRIDACLEVLRSAGGVFAQRLLLDVALADAEGGLRRLALDVLGSVATDATVRQIRRAAKTAPPEVADDLRRMADHVEAERVAIPDLDGLEL